MFKQHTKEDNITQFFTGNKFKMMAFYGLYDKNIKQLFPLLH